MVNRLIDSSKNQLRQEVKRKRDALTADFRREADAAICRRLLTLSELVAGPMATVAAFVASGAEPDLGGFWEAWLAAEGKLFLPRARRNDAGGIAAYGLAAVRCPATELVPGAYGIMEPASALPAVKKSELEKMLWLVPGMAFDAQCRRLGRGKGFYDRLLGRSHGLKIGIFYECQKLAEVPVEAHDQPLDMVVTEAAVYRR